MTQSILVADRAFGGTRLGLAVRAHDGRGNDRGKRSRQGFDLYGASTGRTRKIGSRLRAATRPVAMCYS